MKAYSPMAGNNGGNMAYKVVTCRGKIKTRKKGILFRKRDVISEKNIPNLQEVLMLILSNNGMRAMRMDTSLEPKTHSYLATRKAGDIVQAVLDYESQHRQKDRLYIAPEQSLTSDARKAIAEKTELDVSGCRNWYDFVKAYEESRVQQQSKGL